MGQKAHSSFVKGGTMAKLEERIETWIEAPITEAGYQLYDVYYIKEGKDYFLRVFITKADGQIDLEDCEKVSNIINPILDEKDDIKEQYFLEVSSTGVERVLRKEKHIQEAMGEMVDIHLFQPIEKKKEYIGILQDVQETTIQIQTQEEETISIERTNIALMKIYYAWDEA